MKKVCGLLLCLLSPAAFIGCRGDRPVLAGPAARHASEARRADIAGELMRVNPKASTVAVRLENGIVQTFRYDSSTAVAGLPKTPSQPAAALSGKEGSELVVQWIEDDGVKRATRLEITQLVTYLARSGSRFR
jgi:hypothetical protein